MNAAIVGLGYVGAVTAACLVELGHTVCGVDVDQLKVDEIEAGRCPIVEPQLSDLVARGRASGRLRATTDLAGAMNECDVVVVCVGTPARSDGTVELAHVVRVTQQLGDVLAARDAFVTIVFRSTVPPGTVNGVLRPLLDERGASRSDRVGVAMVPEFLREGSGVDDFFDPPFTVIGTSDDRATQMVSELLEGLSRPVHVVPIAAAEALKYTCNAFHAVKITFANEIGRIFCPLGLDARDLMQVFVRDDKLNTSSAYLRPAFAFGGSCLPKDLRALVHVAREHGVDIPMLGNVLRSNDNHFALAVRRVLDIGHRDVALLGLSFKPETDDLRGSPYVELAETLVGKGCTVRIFDPVVNPRRLIGANRRYIESTLPHLGEILVPTPTDALRGSRTAVVCTNDAVVVEALLANPPERILDLHGGLDSRVEELPGYEGIVW